jgi:curli biogenesis system outer membrane secretion channel CsgG
MRYSTSNKTNAFPKVNARRVLLAVALASACLPAGQTAWAADSDRAPVLTSPVPSIPGPKRTVAVGQIDVIGPYANSSVTAAGGAIAGMLSTALDESGRFVVVERNALPSLITEQTLARSGVSGGSAAPMPGQVLPANYLVVGSITNITSPGAGNGGGFSVGNSNLFNFGGSGGNVTIDLRIIDTRTGGVVKAFSVKRRLTSLNFGYAGAIRGVPVATNQFFNTPLGSATRKALNDAVVIIANSLGQLPWEGQVVEAESGRVYVNVGAEAGITPGTRLAVRRVGRTFTDPATGAVLSQQMDTVGEVTITGVEPKMSYGDYSGMGQPHRGDLVAQSR